MCVVWQRYSCSPIDSHSTYVIVFHTHIWPEYKVFDYFPFLLSYVWYKYFKWDFWIMPAQIKKFDPSWNSILRIGLASSNGYYLGLKNLFYLKNFRELIITWQYYSQRNILREGLTVTRMQNSDHFTLYPRLSIARLPPKSWRFNICVAFVRHQIQESEFKTIYT